MSVISQENVAYRRFQGYADPRFPEGMWFSRGIVTGDGSGGTASVEAVFQPATALALSSRQFSLEQIFVNNTGDASLQARILCSNIVGPPGFTNLRPLQLNILNDSISGSSSLSARDLNFLPLFIGAQRIVGITTAITLVIPNVDTITTFVEWEGYWWGARSILADGGPQRPPWGLYGR